MAPRPQWKGYLKLSLVSCAVALFPAVSSSVRTRFHTLNQKTGHRVRRQFTDAVTGEVVPSEQQVRGYEVAKDSFAEITDEEFDAVALESTHTIDIDRFVKRAKVDPRYVDAPYYLAPDDGIAQQAFAIIRDAMQKKGVVGLARVVMYRRERLVMLEPFGKGMLATTLHYSYEIRAAEPYFAEIKDVDMPAEMLDLAAHIIDRKTGDFDLEEFRDRYETALVALVREKQTGAPIRPQPEPQHPSNVVNLLEALRLSLGTNSRKNAEKEKARPSSKTASRARAKGRQRPGKAKLRRAG